MLHPGLNTASLIEISKDSVRSSLDRVLMDHIVCRVKQMTL